MPPTTQATKKKKKAKKKMKKTVNSDSNTIIILLLTSQTINQPNDLYLAPHTVFRVQSAYQTITLAESSRSLAIEEISKRNRCRGKKINL